jgi:phospholipid/cholesterol/gamma-HCH transport system substrate-binding protein
VHEVVGIFVVALLGLLVAGVWFSARLQGWFEEQRSFQMLLPADVYTGIRVGTEVFISDQKVGNVHAIEVNEDGRVLGTLQVRGSFLRFIREGSQAVVRKRWGVAGDAFIDISKGDGEPLEDLGFLPVVVDEDLTALLMSNLKEIGDSVKFTMFRVNELLQEYTDLARSMEGPVYELQRLLEETTGLLARVKEGEGTVGRLLTDEALAEQAEAAVAELQGALAQTREVLAQAQEVLADVRQASATLPAAADEVPEVLRQAEKTLASIEILVEGLQRHWLVRRYVEPDTDTEDWRLPPAELRWEGVP